jgi:hypothetical protein
MVVYMENQDNIGCLSEHRIALRIQLKEAYGRVLYTYTAHNKLLRRLIKRNNRIGYAQIIFSAISTGGFLGSIISNAVMATWIGGVFATVLLALSLYFKEFNLSEQITHHRRAADELWLIREEYISLLTDLIVLTDEEAIEKRDALQNKTYALYKHHPKTDLKSYIETQKALKSEEEQFFTTVEINKMLPIHLRDGESKGGR